jgi:alcohol dehydrogenase
VVTDKTTVKAGGIRSFKKAFSDSGITLGALADDVADPASCGTVKTLAEVFKTNGCDGIIAVGARAVIDTARGVAVLVSENADDITTFAGVEMLKRPLKPVVVIPTSCGCGAEVSSVIRIGDDSRKVTLVFESPFLVPAMVLLDPGMTAGRTGAETAAAGMNSLADAMEAMLCVRKNPLSDAFGSAAIDLLRGNLIAAVKDLSDPLPRLALANASVLSGTAFSSTGGGAVHALARAAGTIAGIPPEAGMAILLPLGLEFCMAVSGPILAGMLLPMAGPDEYARVPESRRAQRLLENVRELARTLKDLSGIHLTLAEAGVPKGSLEAIAAMAANDPSLLMNPRPMTVSQALELLKQAYA